MKTQYDISSKSHPARFPLVGCLFMAAAHLCAADSMIPLSGFPTQQDNQHVSPMLCSGIPGFLVPAGAGDTAHLYWFPAESNAISGIAIPVPAGSQGFSEQRGGDRVVYCQTTSVDRTICFSLLNRRHSDGQWQLSLAASVPVPTNLIQPRILAFAPTSVCALVTSTISGNSYVYLLRQGNPPTLISDWMEVSARYYWTRHGFLSVRWQSTHSARIDLWDADSAALLVSTNAAVETWQIAVGDDEAWCVSSNTVNRLSIPSLELTGNAGPQDGTLMGIASLGSKGCAFVTGDALGQHIHVCSHDGAVMYSRPTSLSWNLYPSLDCRFVGDDLEIHDTSTAYSTTIPSGQPTVGSAFLTTLSGSILWARGNYWSDTVDIYSFSQSWPVQPLIVSAVRRDQLITVSYITQTGYSYCVQTTTNILMNSWTNASDIEYGTGAVQTITNMSANAPQQFLRLWAAPPQ